MNKEVKITAIVAVITAIFDLLKVFGTDIAIDNNTIYAVVSLIVGAVIYWRNQDWTKESCEATGEMRLKKKEKKGKVNGEYFYGGEDDE
jgi:predicted Co/Zn/Cd cation transporter (cation efflux family)